MKRGHDLVRDDCARLASLAWVGVTTEPVLQESTDSMPALVADIRIQGVWESERVAFFDTRVINADAPSYLNQDWESISKRAAREKHDKYNRAAEDLRGSFTPLIVSCEGVLHREYAALENRLSLTLAGKWNRSLSQVLGWVRVKRQFSVIRAVSLRLRGSRRSIRSLGQPILTDELGLEDGAALPLIEDEEF